MGHGGGNHKKHPAMAGRAQLLVNGCGFHVAVVDAPGHGDRPRTAHDEEEIAELFRARAAGEPEGPIVVRYNAHLAEQAARITIPIEFDLQWDDEHIPREAGLALFDAFASKEKALHANSGKHKELPRFEADSGARFFARPLGRGAAASA
ncbi:hypothetical protein ACFYZH_13120 [Streptomyces abikoensis]|uniref:hypothetical protein n=1 Tax=Streptomyces abikoensis TaxID=97398 RepID=UPI0036BFCD17